METLPGLALYPTSWRGVLVSQNKICFQFNNCKAKLRAHNVDKGKLGIDPVSHTYTYPICGGETPLDFIAVGVPLDLHPYMMVQLIHSYREHIERFPDMGLKDKLRQVKDELDKLLEQE